jgi:hypothetical protein
MSVSTEEPQLRLIIGHICDYISNMVSAKGEQAASMRRQIGDLRSFGLDYLEDKTFGTNLLAIFTSALTLPITADRVAFVRQQLYGETPTGMIAILVVDTAILYCLTTESIFITRETFTSRNEITDLMKRMKTGFDQARDTAADRFDSATYQNLNYLAGSLINHLNSVALQLPSIVYFNYQASMPSLYLSNRIYQDTSRTDDLEDMNDVVHPLFMPQSITGLSA